MHPLKNNGIVELSFSFSFAIRYTFTNSSSLRAENWSSSKIIILSVYMPMILNGVPIVVIRKQGLNVKVVIKSFFL
jgi:hypothetical protein